MGQKIQNRWVQNSDQGEQNPGLDPNIFFSLSQPIFLIFNYFFVVRSRLEESEPRKMSLCVLLRDQIK